MTTNQGKMDLFELLEIDQDRLPRESRWGANYIARAWVEAGRPTEPKMLAGFLDARLRFCTENGVRYPSVLLKRLKQLQRKEWLPRVTGPDDDE